MGVIGVPDTSDLERRRATITVDQQTASGDEAIKLFSTIEIRAPPLSDGADEPLHLQGAIRALKSDRRDNPA